MLLDPEASRGDCGAEGGRLEEVEVNVDRLPPPVRQVADLRAQMDRQQQQATWLQNAGPFLQGGLEVRWGQMDHAIEADDAGPSGIADGEGPEVGLVKGDPGMALPGGLHEGGGEIPAGNPDAPLMEVSGDVARATPEIGDWVSPGDASGEPIQDLAVERLPFKLVADPSDVLRGDLIVGAPDIVKRMDSRTSERNSC